MATSTYTIFDSNPSDSDGGVWPDHDRASVEADSDDAAERAVDQILNKAAKGLFAADGYKVGNDLWACVFSDDVEIARLTCEIQAVR